MLPSLVDICTRLAAADLPLLLGQDAAEGGGLTKTLMGWGITLVGIILGLAAVCRPTGRKPAKADGSKKK